MRVVMTGVTHRTAELLLRERLAVDAAALGPALGVLRERWPRAECVLLSTCNRCELYAATPSGHPLTGAALRAGLAAVTGVDEAELASAAVDRDESGEVLSHLFHVAAGLDSMVPGEAQVLGQVKRAYLAAVEAGAAGPVMHRVFQSAQASAKRARHALGLDRGETGGGGRVSVGSVAADLARGLFDRFDDKAVAVVGVGEITKAIAVRLRELGPGRLWLVNRTPGRAVDLASRLGVGGADHVLKGGPRPWDALDDVLAEADVVLLGTGSREPVVGVERMRAVSRRRRGQPLLLIDVAMPRDVDPAVGDLRGVYLYNLDDLQGVVATNLAGRREAVGAARTQLDDAAARCVAQLHHRDTGRVIRDLRQRLRDIGEQETARTRRKLAAAYGMPHEAAHALLDEHTHRLLNKVLHLPLSRLNTRDPDAPLAVYEAALRELFDLNAEDGHDSL